MKQFLIITFCLATTVFAQKINVQIKGLTSGKVYLLKYYGSSVYYADSLGVKSSNFYFENRYLKSGLFVLLLPDNEQIEFFYNQEPVQLRAIYTQVESTLEVKGSQSSRRYQAFKKNGQQVKNTTGKFSKKKSLLQDYQKLLTTYAQQNVSVAQDYLKELNNVSDDIVNFPEFQAIVDREVSSLIDRPDTSTVNDLKKILDDLPAISERFRFVLTRSMVLAQDRKEVNTVARETFVALTKAYYCKQDEFGTVKATWMDPFQLKELCEYADQISFVEIGKKAPILILQDTSGNWLSTDQVDANFTVLYFWEPDCSHCIEQTPKLNELYQFKLKSFGIEVFAVANAVGENERLWKEFIKQNNLKFINVSVTNEIYQKAMYTPTEIIPKFTTYASVNFGKTFDLYTTPELFLLDKDKKIVLKNVTLDELINWLMQTFPESEKRIEK